MEDAELVYDGVVAVIWGERWEFPDFDEDILDENNSDRVLVFNVVILGVWWCWMGYSVSPSVVMGHYNP